jgi:hypothetical protein
MEVQVLYDGCLYFYDSVSYAYNKHYDAGRSFEKMSFHDSEGSHRFRLKTKGDRWNPKSEQKMNTTSKEYQNAQPKDLFWVDQPMDRFCNLISEKVIQELLLGLVLINQPIPAHMKEYEHLIHLPPLDEDDCYAGSIMAVLTPKQFEEKYNC